MENYERERDSQGTVHYTMPGDESLAGVFLLSGALPHAKKVASCVQDLRLNSHTPICGSPSPALRRLAPRCGIDWNDKQE